MLAIPYLYYKLSPQEGGLGAILFAVGVVICGSISLASAWLLFAKWSVHSKAERWRLLFYALFV